MKSIAMKILVTLCIILVLSHQATSLPRPQQRNDAAVADAIDYLQALENQYSQASRPRFGKRSGHGKIYTPPRNQIDDEEDWSDYPFVGR